MKAKQSKVQIKIWASADERRKLRKAAEKESRSLSNFMVLAGLERGSRKAIEKTEGAQTV
jgi:uncharacterized protein (DUF1778 family)